DDLFQLVLGLVDAGDVGEGDLVVVLAEQARLALAEAHRLAAASLELAHQHEEDHDEDGEREPADHHLRPERLRIFLLEAQHHGLLPHLVEKLGVEGTDGTEFLARLEVPLQDVALDGRVLDLAAVDSRRGSIRRTPSITWNRPPGTSRAARGFTSKPTICSRCERSGRRMPADAASKHRRARAGGRRASARASRPPGTSASRNAP